MRRSVIVCAVLLLGGLTFPQGRRPESIKPSQFEIGRRTFFDFGPPFDFYEIFIVRPLAEHTSIERVTVTPPGIVCIAPAKVESASKTITESVNSLLGSTNPCEIPEKALQRELKRCKNCMVFSGANVVMRVQCGTQTRLIRSDILDKDMFDVAANTPENTSWTMRLLGRLDQAIGPGVMDQPMFPSLAKEKPSAEKQESATFRDLSEGNYDALFQGAPHKPSDLYRAAQILPPAPSVRLISSAPLAPDKFVLPVYPPLARLARIEGNVSFKFVIDEKGGTYNLTFEAGHVLLRGVVNEAVGGWRFPSNAVNQQIQATIEFKLNCPKETK